MRRLLALLLLACALGGCGGSSASQIRARAETICRAGGQQLHKVLEQPIGFSTQTPFPEIRSDLVNRMRGVAVANASRLRALTQLPWPAELQRAVSPAFALEARAQELMNADAALAARVPNVDAADKLVRRDPRLVIPLLYRARDAWQRAGVMRWCP